MILYQPKARWSIATALTWGFASLTTTAVAAVLYFSLQSGVQNTRELVADQCALMVDSVIERVNEHLGLARAQTEYLARQITSGRIDRGDTDELVRVLTASLAMAPQIASMNFFDANARVVRVDRFAKDIAAEIGDWSHDATVVDVVREARAAPEGYWGDVFYIPDIDDAVVNFRAPLRRNGEYIGVLVTTITTRDLSRYLGDLSVPHNAVAFILVGREHVLAYPNLPEKATRRSESSPLPRLGDIEDPVLRRIWSKEDVTPMAIAQRPGYEGHLLKHEDERYGFVYEYLYGIGPIPWIAGGYIPVGTLAEVFERLRHAGLAGVVVLVLAAIAVLGFGRALSRPVLRLTNAADEVRQGRLQTVSPLPPSRLRELNSAAETFNEMVDGLRDREMMRETFGKFVPESIADAILADRGTLRPQTRLTTTLFTDIVGFSTVSEAMDPERLIAILNEYFEEVVKPIERNGGVIHQFQGDAILATYNLPVEDPEHAARAVQTALEIQEVIRARTFGEGVTLATRVGINTGAAVCGTVGAQGRLGFTVHGDDVNLAARIEQMNKELGTRILVAESTVKLTGSRFEFRRVGELPVRGRRQSVVVYRVIGPHNSDETMPV